MVAVAEGLHHAHDAGVVHRDVKPSNVFVETTGRARVLDFSPAALRGDQLGGPAAMADPVEPTSGTQIDAAPMTAGPLGTRPYMPPEQHDDGHRVDARSDVWGLGVTLYELLPLRCAFATGEAVTTTEATPPRRLNPAVDRDLEADVLKSLRKDPAQRYPTAQALADDLHHWLLGEPVAARPARAPRRALLRARRNGVGPRRSS